MDLQRDHIKRPLNSFMVWAKERRRMMNKTNPRMRNADISKILGEEWRNMTPDEKQPYILQAIHLRKQHKIDHPHYRYRPRRKHPDPREERSFFERAMSNARRFSAAFPSLSSSNSPILGPRSLYNHNPIFPAQGCTRPTPSLDPSSGLVLSPKLVSPFYQSHLLPPTAKPLKDYSCLSHFPDGAPASKGIYTNGTSSRLGSLHSHSISHPGMFTASMSPNLPYLMVHSKGGQYPC